MKEILFKAKEVDSGEWVEGYLVRIDEETCFIATKDDILAAYTDNRGTYDGYMSVIDTETICQYTGLIDKNGNKIWENDVVCTPYIDPIFKDIVNDEILNDFRWKVVFYEGLFCVENESDRIYLRDFSINNYIEVIGNIFDNPELLKAGV